MDLIDLEEDQIDAEVLASLAVTMENFRVCWFWNVLNIYTAIFIRVFINSSLWANQRLVPYERPL
jgi:hypothetical protein